MNYSWLAHSFHKYLLITFYTPGIFLALRVQLWTREAKHLRPRAELLLYWFHLKCLLLSGPSGQALINFLCTVFQFNAKPWLRDVGFISGNCFVQTLGKLGKAWRMRRPCYSQTHPHVSVQMKLSSRKQPLQEATRLPSETANISTIFFFRNGK